MPALRGAHLATLGASWPFSHVGLEGLLQWGPRSTTGTGGRTVEGAQTAGPTEVVGFTPHPPRTPWSHPCPNLTFIEKSIHRGVLFQTSQKTHGGGAAEAGPQQRPGLLQTRWNSKRESTGPRHLLTSKANQPESLPGREGRALRVTLAQSRAAGGQEPGACGPTKTPLVPTKPLDIDKVVG